MFFITFIISWEICRNTFVYKDKSCLEIWYCLQLSFFITEMLSKDFWTYKCFKSVLVLWLSSIFKCDVCLFRCFSTAFYSFQFVHNFIHNCRLFHIISARFARYQKYAAPFINMKVSINYGDQRVWVPHLPHPKMISIHFEKKVS